MGIQEILDYRSSFNGFVDTVESYLMFQKPVESGQRPDLTEEPKKFQVKRSGLLFDDYMSTVVSFTETTFESKNK